MRQKAEHAGSIFNELRALRRTRTLEVARDLFHERGYDATTLDDIAGALGATKPFVYGLFDGKREILLEICLAYPRAFLEVSDRMRSAPGGARNRLDRLVRDLTLQAIALRRNIGVFVRAERHLSDADRKAIALRLGEVESSLADLLAAGAAAGEFDLCDARVTAASIIGMITWMHVWHRGDGRLSDEQISDGFSRIVRRMVERAHG